MAPIKKKNYCYLVLRPIQTGKESVLKTEWTGIQYVKIQHILSLHTLKDFVASTTELGRTSPLQELDTHPITLGPLGVRLPVDLTNVQAEHFANTTFPSCLPENIIQ